MQAWNLLWKLRESRSSSFPSEEVPWQRVVSIDFQLVCQAFKRKMDSLRGWAIRHMAVRVLLVLHEMETTCFRRGSLDQSVVQLHLWSSGPWWRAELLQRNSVAQRSAFIFLCTRELRQIANYVLYGHHWIHGYVIWFKYFLRTFIFCFFSS